MSQGSSNGGTPFRPFAKPERPSLWSIVVSVLMAIVIGAVALVVNTVIVWVGLVWVGNFDLSIANTMGIALLWWIADIGLRQGLRDMIRRES